MSKKVITMVLVVVLCTAWRVFVGLHNKEVIEDDLMDVYYVTMADTETERGPIRNMSGSERVYQVRAIVEEEIMSFYDSYYNDVLFHYGRSMVSGSVKIDDIEYLYIACGDEYMYERYDNIDDLHQWQINTAVSCGWINVEES